MKIVTTKDNQSFIFKNQDLHTRWGFIRKEKIEEAKSGTILETNKGKKMIVYDAQFIDLYKKIKRGAQIMLPKDITTIIGECGINKNSRVLDCGAGSGGNACFLASIAKKVYSYEIREDHTKIAQFNADYLGLKNITIKNQDIVNGIKEKELDVIILDMPEPWTAIEVAKKALKSGGFIVSYSPQITQVSRFVEAVKKSEGLNYQKTLEIIEREWEVDENKLRPKFKMLGHTAFLTFSRKF